MKHRQAGYFTGFGGKIGFVIQGKPLELFENEFDVCAGGPGHTDYKTSKNQGNAEYAGQYPHYSRA